MASLLLVRAVHQEALQGPLQLLVSHTGQSCSGAERAGLLAAEDWLDAGLAELGTTAVDHVGNPEELQADGAFCLELPGLGVGQLTGIATPSRVLLACLGAGGSAHHQALGHAVGGSLLRGGVKYYHISIYHDCCGGGSGLIGYDFPYT